jgi:drug/metabolite transporter (DMT)-like permease
MTTDREPATAAAPPVTGRNGPSRAALVAAFATIYLVWGSTYLGIRIAVETMPPFLMAGFRFLVAGAALLSFLKVRGAGWPTLRQWQANAVIGTLLLLGGNGLVAWAEQFVPSGVTALLIGASPLFMVLTDWMWPGGSRPTVLTLGALALGFAGVAWLAAPWETAAGGQVNLGGVLAILGACISWSIGAIYSRHTRNGADPLMAAALQMIGGGAALAVVAVVHGDIAAASSHAISLRSSVALCYLIAIGSLVGFSTFVWLMKHAAPARVSTYAYVNPIVAVILGWAILHEPVGPRTLVAALIIVVSVAIITTEKARRSAK